MKVSENLKKKKSTNNQKYLNLKLNREERTSKVIILE